MAQGQTRGITPYLEWVWRSNTGLLQDFLRFPFTVLSWVYGFVSRLRIFFYKTGLLPKKRVNAHVVSIGNITTGGTGKTPITIYFAEQWQKKGHKVGIVSRGYGRKNQNTVILVSKGAQPLVSADTVGDEPYLMAERLKKIPIVVAADRFSGCQILISQFGVDVILLDDGFQHLKLHRDVNLLLIDATKPFGNGHLLPRGSLRESPSAIKRADHVIMTRTDEQLPMDAMIQKIKPYQESMLQSRFEASALIDLSTHEELQPAVLANARVLPFCGIGNPNAFITQLKKLGARIEAPFIFEDHHPYQEKDLIEISEAAKKRGVIHIVTTEKDAVKIKQFIPSNMKIFALRIDLVFNNISSEFVSKLFQK